MSDGSNETLGSQSGKYRLQFNCTNISERCYYNERMDPEVLAECFGEHFKVVDLYRDLTCPMCGGKKFLIITTPMTNEYR